MSNQPVHLLIWGSHALLAVCGMNVPLQWTRDPQAVTCPKCVGRMELQPA